MATITQLKQDLRTAAAEMEAFMATMPVIGDIDKATTNKEAISILLQIVQRHEDLLARLVVLSRAINAAIEGGAV
jgi:hypothetical protein